MLKPLIVTVLALASGWACAAEPPLTAAHYAQMLGVGMDVDWARTERGIREFDPLVVRDFGRKAYIMSVFGWRANRRKRG